MILSFFSEDYIALSYLTQRKVTQRKVLHISSFNPACLVPSAPKRNQNGGLRIDLDYKDPNVSTSHYLIQTPKLRLPFGMQQHGVQRSLLTLEHLEAP